jgi:KDO2-lipid IV(A) lauroyltransferase
VLRLIAALVRLLPDSWTRRLGALLGALCFHIFRVRRRVAIGNLARALGLNPRQSRVLARRVYDHLCTGALEFLQIGRLTPTLAKQILGPGLEKLRQIQARGRGVLVLSGHLGSWDLLACAASLAGLKVNVVTRRIKATWLDSFWMEQRRRCGVRLLPAVGSARAIVRALRRNEVVAMVLDQHEPQGVPVTFFGRPAATGTALARLALLSDAPVVPAFLLREERGFRLAVHDPLELVRTADHRSDVISNTRRFTQVLQVEIESAPEQWLWLHRRWKVDRTDRFVAAQHTKRSAV